MTLNKVMKLWTAIVTTFLALCTALGLVTTATATTAAAAPRTESPRADTEHGPTPTIPAPRHGSWSRARALPPTMKQRIRAEAHGKSPRCRHRPLAGTGTDTEAHTGAATEAGTATGTESGTGTEARNVRAVPAARNVRDTRSERAAREAREARRARDARNALTVAATETAAHIPHHRSATRLDC